MKTLLLMRHAKSSWKDKHISDRERPLLKRGVKAAKNMGEFIAEKELIPQKIFSSSAVRTLETARVVSKVCDCSAALVAVDEFYLAEAEIYINYLKTLPDDLERVMIIGHNPGLESLLQILSGRIDMLNTAVVAHLILPIKSWAEINNETEGELVELWRPKELFEVDAEKKKKKKTGKKSKSEK
jgi:phosphohistidine phosphatase